MLELELEQWNAPEDELETASLDTVRNAIERTRVIAAFGANQERDPSKLATMIFWSRHPDMQGKRIAKGQTALAAEWTAILRDVVRPALAAIGVPLVPASDIEHARKIAARAVPNMPGVTIASLIEKYRPTICPEIPLPILIAFLKYESGGKFSDATHGTPNQNPPFSSPEFYELGLFQTPAGLHGRCDSGDPASCEHPPPGAGTDSSWHKLCKKLGLDANDWQDPVTQVRVGLMDLEGAQHTRNDYRKLFPTKGTDWDLRAAVLLRFAGGGGYVSKRLYAHAPALKALPENERWAYLRSKAQSERDKKLFANVDKKVGLAWYLGYSPQSGAASAPAPAPVTSPPRTSRPTPTPSAPSSASATGLYTFPGSGKSCPENNPGMPTRCPHPEQVGRCPVIPDLLCVKDIMGIPIEAPKMKRRSDDIFEIVKHGAHTSRFVPGVGTSMGAFVKRMASIGMPLEALYMGDYNCRCLTDKDHLSPHAKGIAVDLYGVRLTSPVSAASPRKSVTEASFRNDAERQIIMRIGACLRLSFPLVLDYNYNDAHKDHFHCDLANAKAINSVADLHRARSPGARANVVFVQEALNALGHRSGPITGKLYDKNTITPLAHYANMATSAVDKGNMLNVLTDRLCEDIAAGKHLGQTHELELELADPESRVWP